MADKRKRWSPITCISSTDLSPSGLIILESNDGEVETLVRTNIELRYEGSHPLPRPPENRTASESWVARDEHLTIHITTHRIVLIDEINVMGGSIPLALVQTANPTGGPSFRSPKASYKIELSTHAWGDLLIVFRGGDNKSYTQSAKDRDEAYSSIDRAMKRKAWQAKERIAMKEALRPSTAVAARKVGVDAIMTKNKLRHRENATLAEAAFATATNSSAVKKNGSNAADIDAFMGEASELIKVIQKYAATIERETAAATHDSTTPKENDTAKLVGMLENMGMTSALSAKQSGSTYHKQLARQLVDFLKHKDKLSQAGGMMTLTDVYCLFNRARGTNMISPEDLLKAVDLMKELKLGLSKRIFASGVAVVQDDSFDDKIMAKLLTDLATESLKPSDTIGGITAMDASRALKISVLLVNEHLLSAEQMGCLCRDVTIEGIRFFPNMFRTGDFTIVAQGSGGFDSAIIDGDAGCYSLIVDSLCSSFSYAYS